MIVFGRSARTVSVFSKRFFSPCWRPSDTCRAIFAQFFAHFSARRSAGFRCPSSCGVFVVGAHAPAHLEGGGAQLTVVAVDILIHASSPHGQVQDNAEMFIALAAELPSTAHDTFWSCPSPVSPAAFPTSNSTMGTTSYSFFGSCALGPAVRGEPPNRPCFPWWWFGSKVSSTRLPLLKIEPPQTLQRGAVT